MSIMLYRAVQLVEIFFRMAVEQSLSISERRTRHVALIVEAVVPPRRQMLTGVAQYIQEHEPWALYLKPAKVEKSLADWLTALERRRDYRRHRRSE